MKNKDGFGNIMKLLCTMLARPESEAFRSPVDWKSLELFDYPEIVKYPMDLGTIKKNIESGKYETVEEVANDIRLVWSNCMLYNRDGSEFYHLADSFSQAFEESYLLARRISSNNEDVNVNRIPSLQEKMSLSHDIYKLSSVELGHVLSIIDTYNNSSSNNNNNNAISKGLNKDELYLNIDGLSPPCFHEINSFILNTLLTRSEKGKKRDKSSSSNSNSRKKYNQIDSDEDEDEEIVKNKQSKKNKH